MAAAAGKAPAYATLEPGLKHQLIEIDVPELGPNDVHIEVTYCGICHSDIHLAKAEWGPGLTPYPKPQVGGHEVVGKVVAKGAAVDHLEMGQTVGVGWYTSACQHCKACIDGYESLCARNVPTCAAGNCGGFGRIVRSNATFAFPIPAGLPEEAAAPMLCGGITVFSPLVEWEAVGKNVGVVGLGGLGSMAVQFAAARGNKVTVFSTSADKEPLARELGASAFVNTKDAAAVAAVEDSMDLIIVALTANVDFAPYISALRFKGVLCFVGAVPGELRGLPKDSFSYIMKQIVVTGSATGGRKRITDMLAFAAEKGIKPLVEVFPIASINEAMEKVDSNSVRFRAVLKW